MKLIQDEVRFNPVTLVFEYPSEWKYFETFMQKFRRVINNSDHVFIGSSTKNTGEQLNMGEQKILQKLLCEMEMTDIIKGNKK